jgi:multiple sugar transport system substrate-binding protein
MSGNKVSRREFLTRTATVAGSVIALAACQPAVTQAPSPTQPPAATTVSTKPAVPTVISSGPMTLQFPSWQQDEPGSSDWFKKRIAEFTTANPQVKIEFTKVANADIASNFLTKFSAGAPPQIVHLPFLNMFDFASQGFLEPLDDYFKGTDILQNWSPLQSRTIWQGKSYALLLLAYGYSMIYNEKMFQDAGITTLPKDGASWVEAVKKLTKKPDVFGTGICTVPGFNFFIHMQEYILGAGGNMMLNGVPAANTPEAVQGVKWWAEVIKAGATPTGTDTGPMRQMLEQGKMATYLDGPWGQGFIKIAKPEVLPYLKVAPMPFKKSLGGLSNVIGMPSSLPAEQKAVVWEFIKSLTTPQAQKEYLLMYCSPPGRINSGATDAEVKAACPLIPPWIDAFNSPDLVDYFPYGLEQKTAKLQNIVSQVGQKIATQDVDIKTELDGLQKQLEDLQKA